MSKPVIRMIMNAPRIILATISFLFCTLAGAQVTIGGNIYGGGNQGNTGGKTTVTIYDGDIRQVYGGARMADVGGSAFVNIDGANSLAPYIIIDQGCGGNDISGHIGSSAELPDELTQKIACGIDNSWNTFVRTSSGTGAPKIFIGRVFAGGRFLFQDADGSDDCQSDTCQTELWKFESRTLLRRCH
jgi:hypothetical protein